MDDNQDSQNQNDPTPTQTPFQEQPGGEPSIPLKPVTHVPKKSKKPLIIAIIAAGLLLIAGLSYAVYYALTTIQDLGNDTAITPTALSAQESAIEDVRRALNSSNVIELNSDSFTFRLADQKYLTSPAEDAMIASIALTVDTQAEVDASQKTANSVFEDANFTLDSLSSAPLEYNGDAYYWTSDKLVCMTFSAPDTEGAEYNQTTESFDYLSYTLTVQCALLEDFRDTAAEAEEFHSAYERNTEFYNENVIFGTPSVKESQTEGYKVASVNLSTYGSYVGGFVGLFYQTPDGVWSYFTGTQAVLSCSDYNTSDIKNAFKGDECYDPSGSKTVTP